MFSASVFIPAVIAALLAYLVGSISTAVIVCRIMNLEDPRTTGSNNPGATNVLRLGGKFPAALTLLGDALKGALPVAITALVVQHPPTIALTALAAFLGHVYPVFFNFIGGKGVATAFGALFGLNLTIGLLAILTWVAVTLVFRMSSLAAIVTFILIPIYLATNGETIYAGAYALIAIVLIYRHRTNIQRILAGTESKL